MQIGDEYWTCVTSSEAKACTIVLRGASKDVLKEVERNLQDAMFVARNIMLDPKLLPGGGAAEMALAKVSFFPPSKPQIFCPKMIEILN